MMVVISILTWDAHEYVTNLLNNLDTISPGSTPHKIFILDQGSKERTTDAISTFADKSPNCTAEFLGINIGFPAGHNLIYEKALDDGPFKYFVVLNSDILFNNHGWLDTLVAFMEKNPRVNIAGPHVLNLQDNGMGRTATDEEIKQDNFVAVSGCVSIIRSTAVTELGLYDNCYTPGYYEDTDLSYRTRHFGYAIAYVKLDFDHHYLGAQNSTSKRKRIELEAQYGKYVIDNMKRFKSRWESTNSNLPDNPSVIRQVWPSIYKPVARREEPYVISGPIKGERNGFSFDIGDNSELRIHPKAHIRRYTHFEIYDGGIIEIGPHVVIGMYNHFQGNGSIAIGKNTLSGPHCSFLSSKHGFDKEIAVRNQPLIKAQLTIGKDVFFGANCTINGGITINTGAVVGANSFVNHDVGPYTVVGGVPAQTIKKRTTPKRHKRALAVVAVGNSDRPDRFNTHTNMYVQMGNALLDQDIDTFYICHPASRGDPVRIPKGKQILRKNHSDFDQLLDEIKPDWIYIWNGRSDGDMLTAEYAQKRGIPVIYSELGWFSQKDQVYFDSKGTNALSEIRSLDLDELSVDERLNAWIETYLQKRLTYRVLVKDFIFVPLQDECDTNIVDSSPYTKMDDFVRDLSRQFPDKKFIVRPHPRAEHTHLGQYHNVEVRSDGNIYDWLAHADAVVGINSTVLLEALLLNKRVFAFGEGLLSGLGVFFEPGDVFSIDFSAISDTDHDIRRKKILSELIFRRQISRDNIYNPKALLSHPVLKRFLGKNR